MSEKEKPKICFITTPGEITRLNTGFATPLEISPRLSDVVNVDVVNLVGTEQNIIELTKLAAEVIHHRLGNYAGFVVTGYTVALQFMAPRLAFAFGPSLDKTIAVTGSGIPAHESHSAASLDFLNAAMVAAKNPFKEVVITYGDYITRGTNFRVGNVGYAQRMVYEPYSQPKGYLGTFTIGGVEVNHSRKTPQDRKDTFQNDFESEIASFIISPGTEPGFLRGLDRTDMKGVVIYSPSLSLPEVAPYAFPSVIDEYARANIPVLITTTTVNDAVGAELTPYQEYLEGLGAILGRYMNPEVALTKFSWAISRVNSQIAAGGLQQERRISAIREIMKKPYVGEFGIYSPFSE